MSQENDERQHRQKWRIWNEQRERQQIKKKLNVEEGMGNYAANLIQKINDPIGRQNQQQNMQLAKNIGSEIQSNVCSICLELMIPPDRQPMILFPCGHNLCKDCLFEHPPRGQIRKNQRLKLQKCTLCRQKIESFALNQSLMTLICMYSNNKELLEKEKQRMAEEEERSGAEEDIEQLRIRCNILQKEQRNVQADSEKFAKEKNVLAEVIEALKKEKKNNQREMQKLEEEGRLIAKCLSQKFEQMELVEARLRQAKDKERVVQKALQPLRRQKEKQQLLEVARLVSKK